MTPKIIYVHYTWEDGMFSHTGSFNELVGRIEKKRNATGSTKVETIKKYYYSEYVATFYITNTP